MDQVNIIRMSPLMKTRHQLQQQEIIQNKNQLQNLTEHRSCDTNTKDTKNMATSPELSPPPDLSPPALMQPPFHVEDDSEASCGFSRDFPDTGTIKRAKPKNKPKDERDGHISGVSSAPSSRASTLKADHRSKSPHKRSPRSPKSPSWRKKESDLPTVKAETARVMEMFLKRRSMSLNDAVLQEEFFLQERKRKDKDRNAPRNKTISVCSTISTDSTEYPRSSGDFGPRSSGDFGLRSSGDFGDRVQVTTRRGAAPIAGAEDITGGADYEDETLKRKESKSKDLEEDADEKSTLKRTVKGSFIKALRHPVDQEGGRRAREQSSADDEASSPEQERGREISRSAPSTLRMQVGPPTKADVEKLKKFGSSGNGVAPHAYPQYHHHAHQRAPVRRESSKKRDQPKRRKSLLDKARQRFSSPSTQRKSTQDDSKDDDSRSDKSEVHKEMKKTGFAARLRRTFGRRDSKKGSRDSDYMAESDTSASVSVNALPIPREHHHKQKRWPSFQFKRKPRKSCSTPTDDSLAGATPSDTASTTDWPCFSDRDPNLSLTEAERQKLLIEIHQGVHLRSPAYAGSDTQLSSSVQTAEKKQVVTKTMSTGAVPKTPDMLSGSRTSSQESNLSSISSESGRHQRPKSLNLRARRAERARRAGLNEMLHIDRTTPGHVRRDTNTGEPLMPPPSTSDDVLTNGAPDNVSECTSDLWETSGGQNVFAMALAETDDSSRSFHSLSQEEQEEFFKRIADRLAQIGDQIVNDYQTNEGAAAANALPDEDSSRSSSSAWTTSSSVSASAALAEADTAETYRAIGERIQQDVDSITMRSRHHLPFPQQSIMTVIRNRTYNTFFETMQSLLGQNTSLEELALVFKFTKLAIKVAHKLGQRASTIKENSIRYIGDRFAEWLDSQGGWGSVVYSSDSESDESKESEID